MSALEHAKQMSREELTEQIKGFGLPEYGLCGGTLSERMALAKAEYLEDGKEPGVAAALNNADTEHVLMEVFKRDPEKVFEGIAALAYALGTERKILYLPESAAALAESETVKEAAERTGTEIRSGILDKRACKGCALVHIVTAASLADALEGTYEAGIYVSVNGGELKKVPPQTKIRDIADLDGAKAVRIGCRYVRPEDAAEMTAEEAKIDNGVIRVLSEKDCIVSGTEKILTAYRKQSCGKCVFCREGLLQLQYMHKEISEGRGKAEYMDLTKELGEAMTFSTPCTMGQNASRIALSAAELCGSEYQGHMKKKCPAGVCFSTETVYIDPKLCEGCGDCMDACPKDCIEGKPKYIHMIDDMACDRCRRCMEVCSVGAIVKTGGKLPKLPNRLTKVGRFKKH